MTCIVIDDEDFAIQHLEKLIQKVPFLKLINSFSDPTEAVIYLKSNTVDLVFVDVEMPYALNGIDVIKLVGSGPKYILTTAYPDYALEGYDLEVSDFLHKPFKFERFLKAVQRVQNNIELIEKSSQPTDNHIFVKSEGNYIAVYFEEICWIETAAERNYISIYTQTERLLCHLSLSDIITKLPNTLFSRIHKSFVVSLTRIKVINKDKNTVGILRQEKVNELSVGESYRKSFYQLIDKKVIKKDK